MARVKEIPLGRSHQMAVCRFARAELWKRTGGIILADGVGLGKTYEALGTVASYLAQLQHGKERKKQRAHCVLVLVPPGLVSKWADELLIPDRFPRYLKYWRSHTHQAVARTFSDVAVLRRHKDLEDRSGKLRYGRIVLPQGLYLMNWNLLFKGGKKVTQIHRTRWDAIIVDEAHHLGVKLLVKPHRLLANPKTKTLLLTATPFQLSPQEMKGLLAGTFGGYGKSKNWDTARQAANKLYSSTAFRSYRRALSSYFRDQSGKTAQAAAKLRSEVSDLLRRRVIRNRKTENRLYHLVDQCGKPSQLKGNPFQSDQKRLAKELENGGLIELSEREARAYIEARDGMLTATSQRNRTFVAGALRQLLSTWIQFRNSQSGRLANVVLPSGDHPKTKATSLLVAELLAKEIKASRQKGWVGKILIFTTYVGSDRAEALPSDEKAHGTASTLKRALTEMLAKRYPRSSRKTRLRICGRLLAVLDKYGVNLTENEKVALRRTFQRFAGSPLANALLSHEDNLKTECKELKNLLSGIERELPDESDMEEQSREHHRRQVENRERMVLQITDRYSTHDLVARYDGATAQEDRDRHLHGFNSPFAPLVLIASSVGQEGIDLQRYCRHVIHYDLEWNPAKLEQREGRVDRQGRLAEGPVNVYFLLCRGTYDERIMHAMVNRFRWHHVLLANRTKLETMSGESAEPDSDPNQIRRIALDLRPT